uniref:Uncharacterized protein n=1 Tax=Streptomyces sp. FR1 TaxID=349971 RepID=V9Z4U7_9ACTN|nr:hypothetical protein pFRL3_376c [Streptomyces sp. FR1]
MLGGQPMAASWNEVDHGSGYLSCQPYGVDGRDVAVGLADDKVDPHSSQCLQPGGDVVRHQGPVPAGREVDRRLRVGPWPHKVAYALGWPGSTQTQFGHCVPS